MLKQGLDVYMPLVNDDATDAVVKRAGGSFSRLRRCLKNISRPILTESSTTTRMRSSPDHRDEYTICHLQGIGYAGGGVTA
jgi:hypothetical protein